MRGSNGKEKEKKSLWKRFLHGFFNWQTLLVASAFLGFFVFAGFICGRISDSYRIPDMGSDNPAYQSSEQGFLIFFIVGSVVSLFIALFAAYMCDHPTLLKDLMQKLFKKKQVESPEKARPASADARTLGVGEAAASVEDAARTEDSKSADSKAPDGSEQP